MRLSNRYLRKGTINITNNNAMLTNKSAAQRLRAELPDRGERIEREFMEQLDAYYASPTSGFYDNRIERRFYEQKLRHIGWKPYPNDGAMTFGASGTNKCDREIVFKHGKVKPEKSDDVPFRGRQRRIGNAVVDFFQLDFVHMPKRLRDKAVFRMATMPWDIEDFAKDKDAEWAFEDAAQSRKVFEHPHPETGERVRFAITAKPDGIMEYYDTDSPIPLLLEYKTKATGITEMNGKLDFKGADSGHLRQVTAESLVFGIREGILLYESVAKPSWFSDADKKAVPKSRKTWRDDAPVPDLRPFYFRITDDMQAELLADLARQAALVYAGETPRMTVEMTGKCGFCVYRTHCKALLTAEEKTELIDAERRYSKSRKAGGYEHRNLLNYLADVETEGSE